MKTSSENMFIDTLKALGLTRDLREAVNDMRKAIMEAGEIENPFDEIRTEQDLINDNLSDLNTKLYEKWNELEEIENRDEKQENDIAAIKEYLNNGTSETLSKYNNRKIHTTKHWDVWNREKTSSELAKFVQKYAGKVSDDVKELFEQLLSAYDAIWAGMSNHHIVSVVTQERVEYSGKKLTRENVVKIDLDELKAWATNEKDMILIQSVIDTVDANKKPLRKDLVALASVQKQFEAEHKRLEEIFGLENKLRLTAPDAYDKYNELLEEANTDVNNVTFDDFDGLLTELEGQESREIVFNILKEMAYLEGGEYTRLYREWRDNLDTGAGRGVTVPRDMNLVHSITLIKKYRSGLFRNKKIGDDAEKIGDGRGKREDKEYTTVIHYGMNDHLDTELAGKRNELDLIPDRKTVDRVSMSIDRISNMMDFVIDITKNGSDANNAAKELKEYILSTNKINEKVVHKIVDGVKNGEIKDNTVIDENLSNILDVTEKMLDDTILNEEELSKYCDDIHDRVFKKHCGEGVDTEALERVDDMVDVCRGLFVGQGSGGTKTGSGRIKPATEKVRRAVVGCWADINEMVEEWEGNNRIDGIAKTVSGIFDDIANILSHINEPDPEEALAAANAKRAKDLEDDIKNIEDKIGARKEIEKIIKRGGENGIVKNVGQKYHILTVDGEDVVVADRMTQSLDGVNYDAMHFEYDGDYGIWTASNFSKEVGEGDGNQNPVEGSGSGWLYTYNAATRIKPDGWHIPTKREWMDLINGYLGKVINNSSFNGTTALKNVLDANEGAILIKSKNLNGLDCFNFGIFPGGTFDNGYQSMNTRESAYYWCSNLGGAWCVKFDYNSNRIDFKQVDPAFGFTACLRFVKD